MFSYREPLCELEHIQISEHLKLTTSASIKFSSLHDLFPSDLAPSQRLPSLISAAVWFTRGSGLNFSYSINTDRLPLLPLGQIDVAEALGVLLRDAEVWSQLSLQANLSCPTEPVTRTRPRLDFVLSLSQADPEDDSGKTRKPWENKTPTQDTRPPSGVLLAHLEEISVALSFSLELPSDTKRPSTSIPTPADGSGLDDDSMLDTDYSSREPAMLSTSSQKSYSGCLPCSSSTSLLDRLAGPEHAVEKNEVAIASLAKLTDASFRAMIYGKKSPATPGIRMTQGSQAPVLAEIAAPLFSPGFLAAMAQRNNYIPSIARSITAIQNRSKSSIFKLEVQQIAKISLEERLRIFQQSSGVDCTPSTIMTSVIKLRLWQISQRKLFDPNAGRRVKPIQLGVNWPSVHKRSSQEILDGGIPQQCVDGCLSDTDDDLLFDGLSTPEPYDRSRVLPYHDLDMLFEEFGKQELDIDLHSKFLEPDTKSRSTPLSTPADVVLDDESDPFLESLFASSGPNLDNELRNPENGPLDFELEDDLFSELLFGPKDQAHDERLLLSDCDMLDFEKTPSEYNEIVRDSMSEDMLDEQHSPPVPNSEGSDRMLFDGYEDGDASPHANGASDAAV